MCLLHAERGALSRGSTCVDSNVKQGGREGRAGGHSALLGKVPLLLDEGKFAYWLLFPRDVSRSPTGSTWIVTSDFSAMPQKRGFSMDCAANLFSLSLCLDIHVILCRSQHVESCTLRSQNILSQERVVIKMKFGRQKHTTRVLCCGWSVAKPMLFARVFNSMK